MALEHQKPTLVIQPIEYRPFELYDFEAYLNVVETDSPHVGEIRVLVGSIIFDGLIVIDGKTVFIDVHSLTDKGEFVQFKHRIKKDMYLKASFDTEKQAWLAANALLNSVPLDQLHKKGFVHV